MREIKFRAWDLKNKKMIPTAMSCIYRNRHSLYGDIYIYQAEPFGTAVRIELMQYTGLKDKNGVEIFEGDILKAYDGKLYPVIYEGFMFNLPNYYDGSADYPTIAFSEGVFEVVGNLYEHKHLLEDTP